MISKDPEVVKVAAEAVKNIKKQRVDQITQVQAATNLIVK